MIYKWAIEKYNVLAEVAARELERIEQKYNGMDAKKVVDESRSEEAVLHECFEWDDFTAAESFREVQAKELIRHLVVVEPINNDEEVEVRAYVSVKSDEGKRKKKYVSIENAMNDDYYKQQVIMQAISELQAFRRKYKDLIVFTELFEAIERIAV